MKNLTFDPASVPSTLTAQSFIGDILVAYNITSRENVDKALVIQRAEIEALNEADRAANKRARFTGQILVDEGYATKEEIDFGLAVQQHLRSLPTK